jgi:hypothetical protein
MNTCSNNVFYDDLKPSLQNQIAGKLDSFKLLDVFDFSHVFSTCNIKHIESGINNFLE